MEQFRDLFERIAARQHQRILRLSFPHDDGPAALLVVDSLAAIESLSRDFAFTLELLSDDPGIPLKALQGKLVAVELVRCDGTLRYFTGHVFGFSLLRHDGVVACYEARVGPWLQYLHLRRDSRLFHNATLHEQADAIFGAYGASVRWEDRAAADAAMSVACQFAESDHNYLSRRWEAAGLFYWYEHDARGHRLVLADDSTANPAIDGDETVLFQQRGGAQHEDSLSEWSPARRITPTGVTLGSVDFKSAARQGGGRTGNGASRNAQGDVPDLTAYEYTGARGFRNGDDGDRLAALRMQELDAGGKYYEGAGNNRCMMAGRWFRLSGLPGTAQGADNAERDAFLVVEARHAATNNYLQAEREPAYDNHVACIRRQVPWRPGRGRDSVDTRILAPQTATVVPFQGQDSQETICTDEYGRVRLRFHWDRGGDGAGTSAWVRVAGAWNGAELGAAAIPRIGSEVLVQWLDGNPDRPIVTGAVPNSGNMPPWELPGQRALTGLRSRELLPDGGNATGGRSNHLVLDDTAGAIQAQLKSDHEHSQLSLGHIARIDDRQGRKDARGEGWELRSDAWGVARAGKGMLLTTEARPRAASHIKDLAETAAHLANAQARQQALEELAQQHGAQEPSGQQGDVADAVKDQNSGIAGASGSAFPQLSTPEIVLGSAAGIALAAAVSTHIASERDIALTAGKNLAIASGGLFASVRQTLRLFVHKAGMRLVAAAGDIDLHALSDGINLLAKLQITQSAGRITINAREEVVINGGGSYIRLQAGGIETGSKGDFVVRAASHQWNGAAGNPPSLPALPAFQERKAPRQWIALHYVDPDTATGVDGAPYEIHFTDGSAIAGKLDAQGKAQHDNVNDLPVKEVQYTPRQPGDEQAAAPLQALYDAAQ
jgi:type VI secretion system secreted protein VgrG